MTTDFNLEQYLTRGVDAIVRDALKLSFRNPRETMFLARYGLAAARSARIRADLAEQGEHIPSFLIASITSECNLHCSGCYARANHSCDDSTPEALLSGADWGRIFSQAEQAGISFILLAGGEPLIRRDVLEQAAACENIIFPIFTNGTLIRNGYLAAFDAHRNLVPILSIEGDEQITDSRRGAGVYRRLTDAMANLKQKDILFGASITVTSENLSVVTGQAFLAELQSMGCKVAIFVEYVPVDEAARHSALTDAERDLLSARLLELRKGDDQMILVSFPGDEKESGGCLAAGRGFFHINARGGAEPCPFSPYSDTSLRTVSLRQALQSPLFRKLSSQHILEKEHTGGCVLFEQQDSVQHLLAQKPISAV